MVTDFAANPGSAVRGLAAVGAPPGVVGIAIALLGLMPDTIAALRAAAIASEATGVGRIWSRSDAIGFSSRSASGGVQCSCRSAAGPNSAACSRARKP